jgi:hypothetical protein
MEKRSNKTRSVFKSVMSGIKFKSDINKLPEQSTVKTNEILKLINGVNYLSEKYAKLKNETQLGDMEDPLVRQASAMTAVH